MTSSVLEIVELPSGEIVLQRADEEGEPLVNINFSEESKAMMPNVRLEIARAMIQAGMQAFADLSQQYISDEDMVEDRIIH